MIIVKLELTSTGADLGFFLGGDAPLWNAITEFFFCRKAVILEYLMSSKGGGEYTLPDPPPRPALPPILGVQYRIGLSKILIQYLHGLTIKLNTVGQCFLFLHMQPEIILCINTFSHESVFQVFSCGLTNYILPDTNKYCTWPPNI